MGLSDIGLSEMVDFWKMVGIPASLIHPFCTTVSPECTEAVNISQSRFRLAVHTNHNTSQLGALSHTPVTVLLPVGWDCVAV